VEKTVRMYAAQAQSSVELKKQCVEETDNQSASERWAVEIRSESGAMSSIDLQDLLALVEARQPGLITELLDSEEANPTFEMSPGKRSKNSWKSTKRFNSTFSEPCARAEPISTRGKRPMTPCSARRCRHALSRCKTSRAFVLSIAIQTRLMRRMCALSQPL